MRSLISAIVLCAYSIIGGFDASAQLYGTEFRFALPPNFRNTDEWQPEQKKPMEITGTVVALQSCQVVAADHMGWKDTIDLQSGVPASFAIPKSCINDTENQVGPNNLYVVSTAPIMFTVGSSRYQTTETFTVRPVDQCGTHYRVMSAYDLTPELVGTAVVLAVHDNTTVKVEYPDPSIPSASYQLQAGQSVAITNPQAHRSFNSDTTSDLTGARIVANAAVSVITGHQCAYVPKKVDACNTLLEHLPAEELYGTSYVIPNIPERKSRTIRVLALHDNTLVTRHDGKGELPGVSLMAGKYLEMDRDSITMGVRSDKPVMVALYSQGFKVGDSIGDPSMMILPPKDAWETSCVASTPLFGAWNAWLAIVTTREASASLRIDGAPPKASPIGLGAGYLQYNELMTSPTARITCDVPVQVVLTGMGVKENAYDGYGHVITWKRPANEHR